MLVGNQFHLAPRAPRLPKSPLRGKGDFLALYYSISVVNRSYSFFRFQCVSIWGKKTG